MNMHGAAADSSLINMGSTFEFTMWVNSLNTSTEFIIMMNSDVFSIFGIFFKKSFKKFLKKSLKKF